MSSSANPTDHAADAADMARLCAGRTEALDALMERHQTRLLHWLIRLTGCEASAEDTAQDAFVRVFEKRQQFKPGAKFSNWLYTIAANLAGIPAMSLPCGFVDGLPTGFQLMGNFFSEARMLNVAHQYQQATDFHLMWPTEYAS
mgnify:CR=1 FL=1